MAKKIAVEEHFLSPGFEDYWAPTVVNLSANKRQDFLARLTDFGEMRLDAMDRAGIERCVLSLAGPGVQAERDVKTAREKARAANDFLAREIEKRPHRYSGFAHLAVQDAVAAADELERCMRELKFCGAMINGHTNGTYLDDRSLDPFWERAQALDALIYLHPADPLTPLALGHLGETLPFLLWRFDSRAGPDFYAVKLAKRPSQYVKENIVVATSGMCAAEPLNCTIDALGHDRVIFAADYPFESVEEAGHFIDGVSLKDSVRNAICFDTAARLLKLPRA